ncbi:MAG: helix-turn-helix transcriptional regulator [Thiotrichales bacterium]|nr:helix-turn-helix transcriptional regulator [Thiotrichales bacterium]
MTATDATIERGSTNVFADLGVPDADAHLVKAELVSRIDDLVHERGLTQTEAARRMGLSQPDVSRLLRGDFREYSLERLLRLLNALGRDIDIVIRPPRAPDCGRLRIATAEPVSRPGPAGRGCLWAGSESLLLAVPPGPAPPQ